MNVCFFIEKMVSLIYHIYFFEFVKTVLKFSHIAKNVSNICFFAEKFVNFCQFLFWLFQLNSVLLCHSTTV